MSDLVERLKRRADEMDALSSAVVPPETLTLAWRIEAKAALDKASRDNDAAAAEITRLQKELETAREALETLREKIGDAYDEGGVKPSALSEWCDLIDATLSERGCRNEP